MDAKSDSASPLLRIEGVSKRFSGTIAVDRLSLDIASGEFFALLGPSGCGKTTLLRMLAGFERPDEGRILLEGEDIAAIPPYQRPVNMMFQSYALFPHMTVEGNVAFGLRQENLPKGEIADRVRAMLALVQLDAFARRKPHQLSGGQRQRVALARALVKRPKLFLLDEPLAALDKKLRSETQFELMALQERLKLTFIVVTHDQEEAMTMADRIGVMQHGRLAQVGSPAEIYEQPASRWVAEFIGDANMLEGRIDADATVELNGVGRIKVAQPDGLGPGTHVYVAIRPEKIRIERTRQPGQENVLGGEVIDIGYLGDLSVYKVKLDGGFMLKAAVANVSRLIERPIGWNDRVFLSFAADAAVVLTQ